MNRHIPIRSCFICRKRFEKKQLMRFVCKNEHKAKKVPEQADPEQLLPGRGIYVCNSSECIKRLEKFNPTIAATIQTPHQETRQA